MKTHELISMPEAELVKAVKTMPIDELEQHAKQIIKDLGGDNYGALMKQAMQTVQSEAEGGSRFETLKALIKDSLPNKAVLSDIYARLAALMMVIISRKLNEMMR